MFKGYSINPTGAGFEVEFKGECVFWSYDREDCIDFIEMTLGEDCYD